MKSAAWLAAVLILLCLLSACGESDVDSAVTAPSSVQTEVNQSPSDVPSADQSVPENDTAAASEPSYTEPSVDLDELLNQINRDFDTGESRRITDSDRYYGIRADDVRQFCAQKPLQSGQYNEIVLCEAASDEAVNRIETRLSLLLDSLLNTAASYDKDALWIVEQSAVMTHGRIIYLVVSPDHDAICTCIESQFN